VRIVELAAVEKLIREEKDPAALQAKLREMIEEAHPAPVFKDGEVMPLHEFERRFKRSVCAGVEPAYLQWQVLVRVGDLGRLTVDFGPTESARDRAPEGKDGTTL